MNVLGLDIGFGDIKVAYGNDTGITKLFKVPSVVALVESSEYLTDDRAVTYEGRPYYVGEDALQVESSRIRDVPDYKALEKYTPVFIGKIISMIDAEPDSIDSVVVGLSVAHLKMSGYYVEKVKAALESLGCEAKVKIVPQGLGAKVALDKYGCKFPNKLTDFDSSKNYIGIDLGFNTLDIFQVINGKASANLLRGIENRGISVITSRIIEHFESNVSINRTLTMKEAKAVLDQGYIQIRGSRMNLEKLISEFKDDYLEETMTLVENEFGEILDKVEKVYLIGGGSTVLTHIDGDPFYERPRSRPEYYNAIGYYLIGFSA